jgi:hypothetical protein
VGGENLSSSSSGGGLGVEDADPVLEPVLLRRDKLIEGKEPTGDTRSRS